jgi:plastocyanin
MRRPSPLGQRSLRWAGFVLVGAMFALASALLGGAAGAGVPSTGQPTVPPHALPVNISATSDFSFVPGTFSVTPGEAVLLDVTQLADFNHTFTLSSVPNYTLPSSDTPLEVAAFFNAHPPLVNLSLGSVAGSQHQTLFNAPTTPGTYEFVCLIHFPTMVGTMVDSNATAASPSSGLSTLELVGIGAGVAIVVLAGVVLAVLRRRTPPKAPETPRTP